MTDALNFPISPGALSAAEIRQLVEKDDPVIIEVGANCGQTTVELLKAMPGATNFAFESEPRAIAKFRDAIANPNVHLYKCAIGAVNGTISFNQSSGAEHLPEYREGWDQSGSIRRPNSHLKVWPWVKFENQITVPITTLDTWSERHQISNADFIWAKFVVSQVRERTCRSREAAIGEQSRSRCRKTLLLGPGVSQRKC